MNQRTLKLFFRKAHRLNSVTMSLFNKRLLVYSALMEDLGTEATWFHVMEIKHLPGPVTTNMSEHVDQVQRSCALTEAFPYSFFIIGLLLRMLVSNPSKYISISC